MARLTVVVLVEQQIPQDTLPAWVWIPLAVVAWAVVLYIYVIHPWIVSRKKDKK